ncbi:MAK10-like protein [Tanacetum coccineum]
MGNSKQAFVDYASSRIDKAGGLVSNFMSSQDAQLSKFEADFKQQQSEKTNKIDAFLKPINDRMTGLLASDTVLAHALMYNAILDQYVKILELGKNRSAFIQSKMPKKMKDPRLFILPWLADETKSYPVGIVRNIKIYAEKLKLLEDFYVIDMQKDPTCPLLVGRGFLATYSVVIDCKKSKITVGEGITRLIFGVREVGQGREDVPYWTTIARRKDLLVFRKMVEFLGAMPINFKGSMWESEDMIDKKIDWNKPPKERDGAWHIRIELIDPDGEKFDRFFQSTPTTRKLFEK